MRKKQFLYLLIPLVVIALYVSCRKTDQQADTDTQTISESRFFKDHISTDPIVQAVHRFVKRQNEKHQFVEKVISKIGYPIWNKAIIYQPAGKSSGRGNSTGATIQIPFVEDSAGYVNASLVVTLNPGDTTYYYVCDWQYNQRVHGSVNVDTTAENLAVNLMRLDQNVFSHTRFRLLDSTLFPNHPLTGAANTRELVFNPSSGAGGKAGSTQLVGDVCVYTYYCGSTWYCFDAPDANGCDYMNCPTNVCYLISESCEHYDEPPPGGNGGGSGGPGGGSSGGGSGGGSVPPDNPCVPTQANNNCGQGWVPLGPDEPAPCDPYIGILQADTTFRNNFMSLNSSAVTGLSYEMGYTVVNRATNQYTAQQGASGSPFINWSIPANSLINGILHSHFNGLNNIFSPDDMLFMARAYLNGLVRDTTNFFFGVTSHTGLPYLIKVTNTTRFRAFAQKIINKESDNNKFSEQYNPKLNSGNNTQNEKNFMQMLQELGCGNGLTLYRAEDDGSGNYNFDKWQKLSWDGYDVTVTNCY